ncbi:hypothetical protein AVEN_68658-1, partial [Araneus ventricosus]
ELGADREVLGSVKRELRKKGKKRPPWPWPIQFCGLSGKAALEMLGFGRERSCRSTSLLNEYVGRWADTETLRRAFLTRYSVCLQVPLHRNHNQEIKVDEG